MSQQDRPKPKPNQWQNLTGLEWFDPRVLDLATHIAREEGIQVKAFIIDAVADACVDAFLREDLKGALRSGGAHGLEIIEALTSPEVLGLLGRLSIATDTTPETLG